MSLTIRALRALQRRRLAREEALLARIVAAARGTSVAAHEQACRVERMRALAGQSTSSDDIARRITHRAKAEVLA
ncbi:MAG: hypothetical protein NDI70_09350 [Pseudomonas sagittaria]|nr:hypothetical protein [Pseudomonas sagittaria]